MYKELGSVLGVDFEVNTYPVDGFQLTLRGPEGETLFDSRMIGYTLWEAVTHASAKAWAEEMEQHNDYELPVRIATALKIEEAYSD
jgi:hypothetical protein